MNQNFCLDEHKPDSIYPGMSVLCTNGETIRLSSRVWLQEQLVILFCREESMTCFEARHKFYLHPGEIGIKTVRAGHEIVSIEGNGVILFLDLTVIPENLNELASGVSFSVEQWYQSLKFESHGEIIFSADSEIRSLFLKLTASNEKENLQRLYLLEIFLALGDLKEDDTVHSIGETPVSRSQLQLARRAAEYLRLNMDGRITLADLSEHFHVSGTQLKLSFKAVYGVSIYVYIRKYKMEEAAKMLTETDLSVLEIAGRLGYENGSKFASAFRTVKGYSPSEYRKTKQF